MLCLSGFELHSRWVPLFKFVITHRPDHSCRRNENLTFNLKGSLSNSKHLSQTRIFTVL